MSRIRCAYEADFFAREDFDETADYGLVHARNLADGTPRHTKTGRVIYDATSPDRAMWAGPGSTEDL